MLLRAAIFGTAGFGGLIACRLYHLLIHPEWTEAESLLALWPFYGCSFLLAMFSSGWLLAECYLIAREYRAGKENYEHRGE